VNPDFEALLIFLANWEAIELAIERMGTISTADELAEVRELERMFALPDNP
jgi:hypothetical protein